MNKEFVKSMTDAAGVFSMFFATSCVLLVGTVGVLAVGVLEAGIKRKP